MRAADERWSSVIRRGSPAEFRFASALRRSSERRRNTGAPPSERCPDRSTPARGREHAETQCFGFGRRRHPKSPRERLVAAAVDEECLGASPRLLVTAHEALVQDLPERL